MLLRFVYRLSYISTDISVLNGKINMLFPFFSMALSLFSVCQANLTEQVFFKVQR